MSKEVEPCLRAQLDLYGRISRAYDNLKKVGSANITAGLMEARLQALEANWNKFETQHDKLLANYWEVLKEKDYLKENIFTLAEEADLSQKGHFLDLIRQIKEKTSSGSLPVGTSGATARTTLPRIQPQFFGRYED